MPSKTHFKSEVAVGEVVRLKAFATNPEEAFSMKHSVSTARAKQFHLEKVPLALSTLSSMTFRDKCARYKFTTIFWQQFRNVRNSKNSLILGIKNTFGGFCHRKKSQIKSSGS